MSVWRREPQLLFRKEGVSPMKHNVRIRVSKKPVNEGVVSCRKVAVREKLLRFLLGDKAKLTVLVPGDSVESLCIDEVEDGGEKYA